MKSSLESELLGFNCEVGHAHLLISYPPQKLLISLIANLKATSSKIIWRKFEPNLKTVYWRKKVFWTGAYFVASCGGVTIDVLKKGIAELREESIRNRYVFELQVMNQQSN